MSQMVTEFYDALISAGADEQKAKKAAEVLFEQQNYEKHTKLYINPLIFIACGILIGTGIGYL